jgi:hypothetical protein
MPWRYGREMLSREMLSSSMQIYSTHPRRFLDSYSHMQCQVSLAYSARERRSACITQGTTTTNSEVNDSSSLPSPQVPKSLLRAASSRNTESCSFFWRSTPPCLSESGLACLGNFRHCQCALQAHERFPAYHSVNLPPFPFPQYESIDGF